MAIILQVLFLSVPEYASVNNSVEKKKKIGIFMQLPYNEIDPFFIRGKAVHT